jgi:hypothetical protein
LLIEAVTLDLLAKPGFDRFCQEPVPKPCAFSVQSISFGTGSILYNIRNYEIT